VELSPLVNLHCLIRNAVAFLGYDTVVINVSEETPTLKMEAVGFTDTGSTQKTTIQIFTIFQSEY
jgi:hypothetical protein